ncbi:MAG: hypothetical protein K8R87_09415, partial [Verrucomicrobia bacterium]|nr:hypothetical protein [Verrucomicrobiota bacterium]
MKKIGVLLSNRETKEPVGFVEIAPSGMLILAAFEGGIHPYALRPLTEELLGQPLYVKHADIISRDKVLSRELLIAESQSLAALINEKPRMLGKIPIAARSVESTSNLSAGQAQPASVLPLPDFMSNPQTPSPSPFTIRVDHGGEDR